MDNNNDATLVCGAIKQLVDISFIEKDFLKSFDIIAKATFTGAANKKYQ